MGHVAAEDHVPSIPAEGCTWRRPVALRAPRASVCQAINRFTVHTRENDLVLIELPITFRGLRKVIGSSMRTRSFSRVWTVKRFIAWHTLARGARRATGRRHVQPSAGMEGT